jgi:hypothetical protein
MAGTSPYSDQIHASFQPEVQRNTSNLLAKINANTAANCFLRRALSVNFTMAHPRHTTSEFGPKLGPVVFRRLRRDIAGITRSNLLGHLAKRRGTTAPKLPKGLGLILILARMILYQSRF